MQASTGKIAIARINTPLAVRTARFLAEPTTQTSYIDTFGELNHQL